MKHQSDITRIIITALLSVTINLPGQAIGNTTMDTVKSLFSPFWNAKVIKGESLFFGQREPDGPLEAQLFYPVETILSFKSATGETDFNENEDYTIDKASGTVRLTPNSRIPSKSYEEMYPTENSKFPKMLTFLNNTKSYIIFAEADFFHKLQVEVTYTTTAAWNGYVPEFAGSQLPNTLKKLKAKEPLKLCIAGDSISACANASKFTEAPPFQPAYGELVAKGLEYVYGTKIDFHNMAVGGWTSANGLHTIDKVADEKPDLVIIAFGMNDANKGQYAANTKAMMEKIRESSPQVEFILVASMLSNKEWILTGAPDRFPAFRDELTKLCGQGTVLADMTSIWTELLKRKSFHDLTGNGVNHPNDFGHRLYAQVILALLVSPANQRGHISTACCSNA